MTNGLENIVEFGYFNVQKLFRANAESTKKNRKNYWPVYGNIMKRKIREQTIFIGRFPVTIKIKTISTSMNFYIKEEQNAILFKFNCKFDRLRKIVEAIDNRTYILVRRQ